MLTTGQGGGTQCEAAGPMGVGQGGLHQEKSGGGEGRGQFSECRRNHDQGSPWVPGLKKTKKVGRWAQGMPAGREPDALAQLCSSSASSACLRLAALSSPAAAAAAAAAAVCCLTQAAGESCSRLRAAPRCAPKLTQPKNMLNCVRPICKWQRPSL